MPIAQVEDDGPENGSDLWISERKVPQETKAHLGTHAENPSLQGLAASRDDELALIDALEKAFDYRGDVTITRADGTTIEGYIFDRRKGDTLASSSVRIMLASDASKVTVAFDTIERIEFTGRDMAHGKTFENWVKRYIEKKLAGETASIESETLD